MCRAGEPVGIARMKKIRILASQDASAVIFERLRDLEIMQVDVSHKTARREEGSALYQEKLAKLVAIKSYFERYTSIKKDIVDMFVGSKPEVSWDDFQKAVETEDIDSIYATVNAHDSRLKELDGGLAEARNRISLLENWRLLDLPLSAIGETAACDSALATFQLAKWVSEEERLATMPVIWQRLWETPGRVGVWILSLKEGAGTVASLVSSAGGSITELPKGDGSPVEEAIASLNGQIGDMESEKLRLLEDDKALSQSLVRIMAVMDYYLDKRSLDETEDSVAKTVYTVVIDGYCQEKDVHRLRDALSDITEMEIVESDPQEGDHPPIVLQNNKIIQPFEAVTTLFGYPHYGEQDPTQWLAAFFWIFFGLTLADVVYGVALGAMCLWLLRNKKQLSPGGRNLVTCVLYCCVSMIILGALMGSWMGDFVSVFMPGSGFDRFIKSMTVLDPINDPLTLMIISLGLGIVHIWVGILVKAIGNVKKGDVSEAIWGQVSWLVFLPGLVIWALSATGMIQSQIPLYVMIAGALMVMYGSSRGTKQIWLKPFTGAYGLYGTISYLADVLSYTRLLALGLASAIIAVVVNKIGSLIVGMIPVAGWVLLPVIMIVGHMFNLMINLLGSYIHSGRLQFVEFFTKFFEGGGKPFRPLKRVNENVALFR